MKKRNPRPRFPAGPRVEASKNVYEESATYSERLDQTTSRLVRSLWWRMNRHHGAALKAEKGLILLDGGRDD